MADRSGPSAKAAALIQLPVLELRDRLARGALRATDLAEAYLAQIEAREPAVQAWAWHDPDFVLQQARGLDAYRASGRAIGPLHGLPVGIKDTIDTAKIPTENGTPIDAGRITSRDATVVARLKAAGALIMGKTVTSELALFTPGKTRNPHNVDHTPGGSSSGSAAAVAARMVPLAIGTQTAGSVIRPAAFCGVTGFKASFGLIPRSGVLQQAPSLDTVGVFAEGAEGAALLADALAGYDESDEATAPPLPPPRLLEIALAKPPVTPALAFVPPPDWQEADEQTHAAFAELTGVLGDLCNTVELPDAFRASNRWREQVQLAELAKSLYPYERRGRDLLSEGMRAAIDQGKAITARDYLSALDWREVYNAALEAIFERFDAIITAAAPGPAPLAATTGSPIFNGLWTFCGTPAVSLPLLAADNGLPMGVQLIGRRGDDGRLLRTARWLVEHLAQRRTTEGASANAG